MKKNSHWLFITGLIIIIIAANACVSVKSMRYFNDISSLQEAVTNPRQQKTILPFDKLYIKVYSIDEKTNQLFNLNSSGPIGGSSNSAIGNVVDEEGNISFPFIGKVNLQGLTLDQAGVKIAKALSEYVSQVSVDVKFFDNNITVLGEVQRPGMYPFSQDKLTIYEAIALGGGLTRYADRKKVMLVRQEADKIMHFQLDLSSSKIEGKEYYYVHTNDVLIVEPMRSAAWYNFNSTNFSAVLTSITTFLAIFTILFSGNIKL